MTSGRSGLQTAPRRRPDAAARGLGPLVCILIALAVWTPGPGRAADATAPAAPAAPTAAPRSAASLLRDPAASPLLNRHYRAAEDPAPRSALADAQREVSAQRFAILAAAQITPGMRIAEFGVGQGLLTALFARAVGTEGIVYGVDSAPDLPEVLKALAREYHVANLVPVASTGDEAALPSGGIDLAFIGGGVRQFTDPLAVLATIHRALVPAGTLIIVAPRAGGGPAAPDGRDGLLARARQAGFRLVEEAGFLRENSFLRFERAGDDTEAGSTTDPVPRSPETHGDGSETKAEPPRSR